MVQSSVAPTGASYAAEPEYAEDWSPILSSVPLIVARTALA